MRSCSEPGGHAARVSASWLNSIWPGAGDFHLPLPRLQSMRMVTPPSASNSIVYLALTSGTMTAPLPSWILTSCHDGCHLDPPTPGGPLSIAQADRRKSITAMAERFIGYSWLQGMGEEM